MMRDLFHIFSLFFSQLVVNEEANMSFLFFSLFFFVHLSSWCHETYGYIYIYANVSVYWEKKWKTDVVLLSNSSLILNQYYFVVVVVYLFFLLDGHTHTFMTNSARKTQSVSLTSFLLLFLLFYFSSLSPSIQRYSHYSLTHSLLLDSAFSPSSFFSFIFF